MMASLVFGLAAAGAGAQALFDPTRPPAAFLAGATGGPGGGAGAVAPLAPQVQSILIAPGGGRNVAVINGQTVRPGDWFQGARVDSMTQTEVVLSKGGRKQVLKLYPAPPAGKTAQPVQQ